MFKRVITAAVCLAIFVPVMIFPEFWTYPALWGICGAACIYELVHAVGYAKKWSVSIPLIALGAVSPFLVRMIYLSEGKIGLTVPELYLGILVLAAAWILFVGVAGHKTVVITDLGVIYLGFAYILGGFGVIEYFNDFVSHSLALMICVGAWVTDTFAYFGGRLFGKKKLIPEVSPKKTVAGALVGGVCCLIAFAVYGLFFADFWENQLAEKLVCIGIGAVACVASQFGDLCMSLVKRHYNVKDYSHLLPGHGGVLDRFDSVMAVSAVTYAIIAITGLFFS